MAGSLAIRWRLTIWIALAFALAIAVTFVSLWLVVATILDNDVDDDLTTNYVSVLGVITLAGGDVEGLEDRINVPYPVVIFDGQLQVLAENDDADAQAMTLDPLDQAAVLASRRIVDRTITIDGEEHRVRAGRASFGDFGEGIVVVGRNTETVHQVREALATVLFGGGAIAILVVIGVAYWLARGALRPVEQMTGLASHIEASDLKRRIGAKKKPAEVQRLADTFDAMLARLESAFAQQRNFVMDVSHELRTPLTGLRGNLDVMLMDPTIDADTRQQLEKMSSEVSRLIRLTSNLLYLAHAEAGRDIARRPVELDALALEVVHQERNVRPDVSVRLGHEEQVSVDGDRDLLKQLLLNVVDNAIKYSPPGSEVVLSLHHRDDDVEIEVEDRGPGIPPEQLDKIFDRFYRVDGTQSRTVGGTGIGLAISKWIAQAHGGDIRVESNVGEGSRFILTLPLSAEKARATVVLP